MTSLILCCFHWHLQVSKCLFCLHSGSSSSKELSFLLICSRSCWHLNFDTVLTVHPLIVVAPVYRFARLHPWLINFFRIDLGPSTWFDLSYCIPGLGCTWVKSNVLSLFIHFFLFNIIVFLLVINFHN